MPLPTAIMNWPAPISWVATMPWPANMYSGKYIKHRDDPPRKFASEEARMEVLNRQVKPAADVARILDEAQVPNLLWGTMAAWLVGDWRHFNEDIQFLVLDHLIQKASDALFAAGFTPCTDPGCDVVKTVNNDYLIPPVHFHVEALYPEHEVLRLYPKSSHLWWLPDFGASAPAADDPHLMLSNDPRFPPYVPEGMSGPWTEVYPIKVLNRSSFTEAALWLFCRDIDHANAKERPEGITLPPRFQAMWQEFTIPEEQRTRRRWDPMVDLVNEMRANNELPPPPRINWFRTVEEAEREGCWF
ncbi:Pc06g00140 [Penicillium rubens Wisconsin 54-1255]|uniref:Pc06g00140 protein n=1 Tax=Penicillium rubens (strain ATCC 28089 / DSM 1075 / NRRL 1951 / Wisconsin 54-1255) TaxID=500485 RepID=B6GVW0_PENRW|nr:Pc06g00140 [Penicillium rubens Wisconsin 54-1255]